MDNGRLDRLEALDDALQAAVDAAWPLVRERATGVGSAACDAGSNEPSPADVVAYAQHISYTAAAPPGYKPGMQAPWFAAPAPGDAEARASVLFAPPPRGFMAALAAARGARAPDAAEAERAAQRAKRARDAGGGEGEREGEPAKRQERAAAAPAPPAPAAPAAPPKETFFVDQVDLDLVSDDERVSVSDYSSSEYESESD